MSVKDLFDLSGQVAIITGGAGLLGVKHAEAIAESGGLPILVDIDSNRLLKAKETMGALIHEVYVCDITKKKDLKDLLDWAKKSYGKVDILVNNAAINPKVESSDMKNGSRFEDYSIDTFQKEFSIGITAALLCSQIFGVHMAENRSGVILNISSDLGLISPNQSLYKKEGISENLQPVKPVSYSIIKHGLIGLTRYVATYWASKGVRCNALAPGGVENGQDQDFLNRIQQLIPMGRLAHVDDYKAAVVFLVSKASAYMTGAVLSVDGGRTCW
jgi:NAD(P)-dependent dehydrogenase (short-subunit alcohol dehydrogenase family)